MPQETEGREQDKIRNRDKLSAILFSIIHFHVFSSMQKGNEFRGRKSAGAPARELAPKAMMPWNAFGNAALPGATALTAPFIY